jgi:hypothetical protein
MGYQVRMKLKAYREMRGLSVEVAAAENGVTPTCWRYWERDFASGKKRKIPGPDNISRLYVWSHGQVTPHDFYDLPALPDAVLAADGAHGQRAAGVQGRSDAPAKKPYDRSPLNISIAKTPGQEEAEKGVRPQGPFLPGNTRTAGQRDLFGGSHHAEAQS